MIDISRQTFLKFFLDLVYKGFLRSESDIDILSVNNKVSLGISPETLTQKLRTMNLSSSLSVFAL